MYELNAELDAVRSAGITRTQFMQRGLAAGVSFSTLAAVLSACGGDSTGTTSAGTPSEGTPPSRPTGRVVFGDSQPPRATNWDPASSFGGQDLRLFSLVYEPLIDLDEQGKLIPLLATRWERTSPTTVRLQLRQGVRFHDGTPLTARDVKASIERVGARGSRLALAGYFTETRVEVVDEQTVDVVASRSYGPLENVLAAIKIMPAAYVADEALMRKQPVGTGPYRFVSRNANDTVLTANADYWEAGKPHIKDVVYRTIADANARIDALKTGAIDFVVEASPAQISEFGGNAGFYIPPRESYAPAQYTYIIRQTGPLLDVRVRQAIAYAVDRETINRSILRGVAPIAYSPLPTTSPFYTEQSPRFEHDPEKARALLAEAGHSDLKLSLPTSTLFQFAGEADQAVAEYLREAGVTVDISRIDVGAFGSAYTRYDISLNAFVGLVPDVDQTLALYRPPFDTAVFAHSDPRMARLADAQRYIVGDGRRAAVDEATAYIWNQQTMLWLSDTYLPEIVAKRVNNYRPAPSFTLTGLKSAWV